MKKKILFFFTITQQARKNWIQIFTAKVVAERTSYVWRVSYFDRWSRHIISPNGDYESNSARTTFPGISNSVKARQTTSSTKSFELDGRISTVFLSVVWNFCFRGRKKSHQQSITRKRMVACSIHFHGVWLWKSNVKRRKSMLTLLVEIERVRVFSLEVTQERVCWPRKRKCEKRINVGRWVYL